MDSEELVTVYTVGNPIKGEIIKNALEAEGIRCFIEGGNQAGEAGLIGISVKLQVPVAQAERAAKFIEEHDRGERPKGEHRHPHDHHEHLETGIEPHSD